MALSDLITSYFQSITDRQVRQAQRKKQSFDGQRTLGTRSLGRQEPIVSVGNTFDSADNVLLRRQDLIASPTEVNPYYFTARVNDTTTVFGGPFPARTLSGGASAFYQTQTFVVNPSNAVQDYFLTQRSNDFEFRYYDTNLTETIYQAKTTDLGRYVGGGIWYQTSIPFIPPFQFSVATKDTDIGSGVNEIREICLEQDLFINFDGETSQIGNSSRLRRLNIIPNPSNPSGQSLGSLYEETATVTQSKPVFFEFVTKTGVQFHEFAQIRNFSHVQNDTTSSDPANTGELQINESTVETDSEVINFEVPLYRSLTVPINISRIESRTSSRSVDQRPGTTFTQDDASTLATSSNFITNRPFVLLASSDETGCLYQISKSQFLTTKDESRSIVGTVGAATFNTRPGMRSPVLFGFPTVGRVVLASLAEEGPNGGWFAGSGGGGSGLACPFNPPLNGILRSDFDSSYGDNSTNSTTYCEYNIVFSPNANATKGGKIGGDTFFYRTVQSGIVVDITAQFPSQDITETYRNTEEIIIQDPSELYIWHEASQTRYRLKNDVPDNRFFLRNLQSLGLNAPLLLETFRGEVTVPDNPLSNLYRIQNPFIETTTITNTHEEKWTDPTTPFSTSRVEASERVYTLKNNLFLDNLLGRSLFIVNTTVSPWVRLEATITDAFFAEADTLDPIPTSGDRPKFQTLTGFSCEVTDGTRLEGNWDADFLASDAGSAGVFAYLPSIENLPRDLRHTNPDNWFRAQGFTLTLSSTDVLGKISAGPHIGVAGYEDGGLNVMDQWVIEDLGTETEGVKNARIRKLLRQSRPSRTVPTPNGVTVLQSASQFPQ